VGRKGPSAGACWPEDLDYLWTPSPLRNQAEYQASASLRSISRPPGSLSEDSLNLVLSVLDVSVHPIVSPLWFQAWTYEPRQVCPIGPYGLRGSPPSNRRGDIHAQCPIAVARHICRRRHKTPVVMLSPHPPLLCGCCAVWCCSGLRPSSTPSSTSAGTSTRTQCPMTGAR
jgi:hypothetical protein